MDCHTRVQAQRQTAGCNLIAPDGIGAVIFQGMDALGSAFKQQAGEHLLRLTAAHRQTTAAFAQVFVQLMETAKQKIQTLRCFALK